MRNRLILISILWLSASAWAQTTTITGTIDDLTVNPVTSGKVVFTLKPSVDTTISGNARFTPGQPVTCYIQSNGTLLNAAQTGACVVVSNTSLTPAGTSYRVDICPYNACSSSFNFYAINSSYNISSIVPTPTTGPAQNFTDVFSNQVVAGNKTFTGTTVFGNTTLAITTTCALNGNLVLNPGCFAGSDIGAQINAAYAACPSVGCTVDVPAGSYSYSTPIVAATSNKPLVLRCGYGATSITGTTLTYTNSTGIAINLASGLGSAIKGCAFVGPSNSGNTIGLAISNATGSAQTQSQIEGSSVSGFGTCLSFGNNSYLISFRENSFFNCTRALSYPNTTTGSGEDLIFYGGLIEGVIGSYTGSCVDFEANAETVSFFGVSFDSCGITINGPGNFQFAGGNMENLSSPRPNGVDFLNIGSSGTQATVSMSGVSVVEDSAGGTNTELIKNGANGGRLTITGGRFFAGSTLAELVNGVAGSITAVVNPFLNWTPTTGVIGGSGAATSISGGIITSNTNLVMNATNSHMQAGTATGATDISPLCTMSAGSCTYTFAQGWGFPPHCVGSWNGAGGSLTGILKIAASTSAVVATSSVGSDTPQIAMVCMGAPN
jgi:hypothetical protein